MGTYACWNWRVLRLHSCLVAMECQAHGKNGAKRRCRGMLPLAARLTSCLPGRTRCRRWCRPGAVRRKWRGRRSRRSCGARGRGAWEGAIRGPSQESTSQASIKSEGSGSVQQGRGCRSPQRSPQVYLALVAEAAGPEIHLAGARQAHQAPRARVHRKGRLQARRAQGAGSRAGT